MTIPAVMLCFILYIATSLAVVDWDRLRSVPDSELKSFEDAKTSFHQMTSGMIEKYSSFPTDNKALYIWDTEEPPTDNTKTVIKIEGGRFFVAIRTSLQKDRHFLNTVVPYYTFSLKEFMEMSCKPGHLDPENWVVFEVLAKMTGAKYEPNAGIKNFAMHSQKYPYVITTSEIRGKKAIQTGLKLLEFVASYLLGRTSNSTSNQNVFRRMEKGIEILTNELKSEASEKSKKDKAQQNENGQQGQNDD